MANTTSGARDGLGPRVPPKTPSEKKTRYCACVIPALCDPLVSHNLQSHINGCQSSPPAQTTPGESWQARSSCLGNEREVMELTSLLGERDGAYKGGRDRENDAPKSKKKTVFWVSQEPGGGAKDMIIFLT